ncbi:MAG: hypothetical protein HY602_01895 [Parcubacteria group bacterium]|nr:hypothetical protein [Parcubacteria group bacterium]
MINYLWLALAGVLTAFANGRWVIPAAVWLAPIFWLRFIRTQPLWKALMFYIVVGSIAAGISLQGMVPVPPSAYIVMIAIGALISFIPFLIDRWLYKKFYGFISTLPFPLAFTALEYLNTASNPFGSWGSTAYTLADNLPLMQLASVTGIWGVTFLTAWFASTVNWAWENHFDWGRIRRGCLLYTYLIALILFAGGARLLWLAPTSPTVPVAAVTSTFSEQVAEVLIPFFLGKTKETQLPWDDIIKRAQTLNEDILEKTQRAARAGAKIVFWAEAGVFIKKESEEEFLRKAIELAKNEKIYLGATLAVWYDPPYSLPDNKKMENKIILITPSGEIAWKYLKAIPVPGAENALMVKGDGVIHDLETPYGKIAAAICFDLDFPNHIRQAGQKNIGLMFAPSGDWKEISPYHTYMASVRAIENGFSLVRPTRGGLSAAFDYRGKLLAQMDHFTTQDRILFAHIPTQGVKTLYSRLGDWFAWLSLIGLGGLVLFAVRRR